MKDTPQYRLLKSAMRRFDAWSNTFTGLGTTRDKMTFSTFSAPGKLADDYLDNLYHGDDMAARSCDTVPEEMLRRGFEIRSDDVDSETITAINDALKDLDVRAKFTEAGVWARVFGGCIIFVGADDGQVDLSLPLNEMSIKTLDHLNVIDKRYAMPHSWYELGDPKFGLPEKYLITLNMSGSAQSSNSSIVVHESRLIRFDGLRASTSYRQANDGWGLSLLQRMNQILQDYGMSFQSLAHLLGDANQGVFKMKGLMDALAANEPSLIQARMQLLDMGRSDVRSVVLDEDGEDFTRQNFNWSGIKDPYTMMMLRLSSAARMPVTIMMSQSPSGMDATGESDIRWFYDQTESHRGSYLEPKLEDIIRLVTLAKDGPTGGTELENYTLYFPSLWQPTQKEEAEIYELNSRGDKNYTETGVLLEEEVALSRFTPNGYSTEITINTDAREAILKGDVEELLNPPAPEPPPMVPPVVEPVIEPDGEE
jgi:phage-related protein (TIGR01555 family)